MTLECCNPSPARFRSRPLPMGEVKKAFPLTGDKFEIECYFICMTIKDLENAVTKLPPDEFAKFREWFEAFDAARFDEKIERDVKVGKLDRLAEQALSDFRKGRASEL
jgi:hypothetical protein